MSEPTARDRAQSGYSLFLRRIGKVKAGDIARMMDLTDGQLSEIKTKKVEDALLLLAHLGLKCVPAEFRCVDPATFEFLTVSSKKLMNEAPHLLWDEEQA